MAGGTGMTVAGGMIGYQDNASIKYRNDCWKLDGQETPDAAGGCLEYLRNYRQPRERDRSSWTGADCERYHSTQSDHSVIRQAQGPSNM
jgi:hypothetical protein